MPPLSWISGARVLAAACLLICVDAQAQTPAPAPLLQDVHTVAAATQAVPVEETFTIATAGTYQITLNDLGAQLTPPAPLASAKLAITSGTTVVGTPIVSNSGSTSWSTTFSATPGTYVIHVVGAPSTTQDSGGNTVAVAGSGTIGMQVTNTADNSQVASFSDTLAFPAGTTLSNVGALNDSFTVATAGSYQVTLTDMQLPGALSALTLAIVVQGGSLITDPTFATAPGTPTVTTTVSLQTGTTYRIFAGGQAAGAVNAGLYGVNVSPVGGGAPVYSNTVPVGAVTSVGSPTLNATVANYTLTVADLAFPTALSQVGAAVTFNGQSVTQLNAAGTTGPFIASSNPYQVFAYGVPPAGGQGAYTVSLQPVTGASVLNVSRAVTDPTSGVFAYSYDTTTVGSETYSFDLADFGYPASFTSIKAAAVQAGALLSSGTGGAAVTSLSAPGTLSLTPAAGPVTLLVFAKPQPTASATAIPGGLFGVDLTANNAGAPTFETSQGVGQVFIAKKVTVTSGGNYQVVLNDLGFPANFANLAVVVTRGTSRIGSVFGGGTLPFAAIGGDYLINFVAQPAGTDLAGTYSIVVGEAPPPATATVQASATSVNSGGTVTLTWSSQNTTACTASSTPAAVWSGTLGTSGTATSAALAATTTFTITCTGDDGTSPTSSTTVTINSSSPSKSSGGGGGALGTDLVAFLLGLLTLRLFRERGLLWSRQ